MMAKRKPFLEPNQLRNALLCSLNSKEKIVDTARIVAAYYLGFPLFIFKEESSRFPSLFLWAQYSQEGIPDDAETLSREEVAIMLPTEYSPRFPIILLNYCNLELEAVLYSDHFNDRRTTLLLRLYIDNRYGLSLTNAHISDLCYVTLPKYIRNSMFNLSSLQTSLEHFVDSLMELDIILVKDYITMLENYVIERIEYLFSELSIQAKSTANIPRVPVYYTPEQLENVVDGEDKIHLEIHVLIHIILYSLHRSNRLTQELTKALMTISESRETRKSGKGTFSVVVRIVLVIMAIIFRDSFSLAVIEKWEELPEISMKYKALLGDISEADRTPFQRWYSLATEQDINHLNLFFEWARGNYSQESALPPLTVFTRDVWCKTLLERRLEQLPENFQTDWVSGLLIHTNKIDSEVYNQMLFISSTWKCFTFHDPSLIAIRLALAPSDLCSSKTQQRTTFSSGATILRKIVSARDNSGNIEHDEENDDDKLFTSRDDLAASYAKHGNYLFRREIEEQRRRHKKDAKYLKNIHRHNIMEMMNNQMNLVSEIEDEKNFLASIDFTPVSSPSTYSRSTSFDTKNFDGLWSCRSNKAFQRPTAHRSSGSSSFRSQEASERKDSVEVTSENGLKELDVSKLEYDQTETVMEEDPTIEKLDFSLLSPMPTIRNSRTVPTFLKLNKIQNESAYPKDDRKLPVWMKLLPLENTSSDRTQLFKLDKVSGVEKSFRSFTERLQNSSMKEVLTGVLSNKFDLVKLNGL